MTGVRRIVSLFQDSPGSGQDRVNLVSGFTIGITGLLLNSAVLLLLLPLMVDPNDRSFREITASIEFGQLLALMLLGGATAFATLLIPLRLVSVFWGPRVGRYFDQIVLTGITPFRFVIGKATSQNYFLGLVLFLLLPWMVLSLTLGGVNPASFLAGLILLWLYCMALAVATLWLSLYFNELLAAGMVIGTAAILAIPGCAPLPVQPFVMTPFPALLQPVYAAMQFQTGQPNSSFAEVFLWCAACISGVICVSLAGISMGPLYGIIRENSTFGEVVRRGDSSRKRRIRIRPHIQRSSEIAFFYENRGSSCRRSEGLVRWGSGFCALALASGALTWIFVDAFASSMAQRNLSGSQWWIHEVHTIYLIIHGLTVAVAILLFSHAKNSTGLRLPFIAGRRVEVGRLDTGAFALLLALSTATSMATPLSLEQFWVSPAGGTVFPSFMYGNQGPEIDFLRTAIEGSLVISIAGLTIYAFQRFVCLTMWMKSAALALVGVLYFVGVCMVPLLCAALTIEFPGFREDPVIQLVGPRIAMISPFVAMMFLFNELGSRFPDNISMAPFYVSHAVLLLVALPGMRRNRRRLSTEYLPSGSDEEQS